MPEDPFSNNQARVDELISVLEHIAQGDFLARYTQTGVSDQIEAIGVGINMLAEEIAAKMNELERFNKLFVDRELAMVALKERIEALESEK